MANLSNKHIENIVIAAIWLLFYLWPLFTQWYAQMVDDSPFSSELVGRVHVYLTAYMVLFLLHHFVAFPRCLDQRHYRWYALNVVVIVTCFCVFLVQASPVSELRGHDAFSFVTSRNMPRFIIALLMLGVDAGAVTALKAREQRLRLVELEQQNLKQELEYLKHQFNPHFFMNTLNNIHVLIDIDKERAKRCLVEFSQLMRYILYEGNGAFVPLSSEVEFISQYLSLMKIRYSDCVELLFQMPSQTKSLQIPPLLLVTFIENAFKHGISYRHHSFVHIRLHESEDGQWLLFECVNSRHAQAQCDEKGGIGLENVRKRLDLIFDSNYQLTVDDRDPHQYSVSLKLPTHYANQMLGNR